MTNKRKISIFLSLHILFYILAYIGLFLFIIYFHLTYSFLNMLFVLFPFVLVVCWVLFLLKKSNHNNDRKKIIKRILIMSIFLPFFCILLLGINHYNSQFNTEKWLNKPNDRVYMIGDFLEDYKLKGMTKGEIYSLLGKPENENDKELEYYLGSEQGLIRIDSEVLVIYLNKKEIVINYELKTG